MGWEDIGRLKCNTENKVTDYFTNLIFSSVGTQSVTFQSTQQVPKQGRVLPAMDTNKLVNILIFKKQNKAYA